MKEREYWEYKANNEYFKQGIVYACEMIIDRINHSTKYETDAKRRYTKIVEQVETLGRNNKKDSVLLNQKGKGD